MADYQGIPSRYAAPLHANSMGYYKPDFQQAYGAVNGLYGEQDLKLGPDAVAPGQRKRMNILAVAAALFVPWLLFCAVCCALSFSQHYNQPQMVYGAVGAALLVVLSFGVSSIDAIKNREIGRQPSWYLFMFLTSLLAWCLGVALGNYNFFTHLQPFYDVQNLNVYRDVDPGVKKGQQMMDAGRIIFVPSARPDLRHAWSFKNQDTYCVAPVTTVDVNGTMSALPSYDFWAVGLNCCSGNGQDFKCGDYNHPTAHAGLRLMRDDLRPYFRLAVQQAQAAHSIKSMHPLFLFWMEDPIHQAHEYEEEGYKDVLLGLCAHFSLQMLLVVSATLTFAKTYWS